MPKSNHHRNKNKKYKKAEKKGSTVDPPHEPEKPLTVLQRLRKLLNKTWFWVSVISTLIGIVGFWPQFHQWTTSDKELYHEQYFIDGILLPNDLIANNRQILLNVGRIALGFSVEELERGADLSTAFVGLDVEGVKCKIINRRLFFSTTIRNLDGEIVGQMDYNRWSLFKPNLLYYDDSEGESLTVTDKKGFIVFSIRFKKPNEITLRGYFVGQKSVLISSERGFRNVPKREPGWKLGMDSILTKSLLVYKQEPPHYDTIPY